MYLLNIRHKKIRITINVVSLEIQTIFKFLKEEKINY